MSKLGLVIRSEKYWPRGTEPKGLDHYVDVEPYATEEDG